MISRFNRSDLTMEEPAETALYVLNMLALCQESHRYMACFTIKGGLVLLEQACETYNAQLREQSGEETILSLAEALELSVQLNSSA